MTTSFTVTSGSKSRLDAVRMALSESMSVAAQDSPRHFDGSNSMLLNGRANILEFGVVENSVLRPFSTEAGFLDTAEGRHLRRDQAGIQAYDSVLERFGHPPRSRQIARVDIGGQAKLGVVGHS